jgi:hypothetical protein
MVAMDNHEVWLALILIAGVLVAGPLPLASSHQYNRIGTSRMA